MGAQQVKIVLKQINKEWMIRCTFLKQPVMKEKSIDSMCLERTIELKMV